MTRRKMTTAVVIGSQPATDYEVLKVELNFFKDEAYVWVRHLSSEGHELLRQVVRLSLNGFNTSGLETRILDYLASRSIIN